MRTFTDKAGRVWTIEVSVNTVRRVRALTGHTLTDLGAMDSELTRQAGSDPLLLPDLLYAVCKPQADADGVTDVMFGEALAGDVLEKAVNELIEEVCDFFPNAQRRTMMRLVLGKTREAYDLIATKAIEELTAVTPEAVLNHLLASSTSATSTPASSGSTPAP